MYDVTLPRSSFAIKFIECFLFAFALVNVFNSLILYPVSFKAGQFKQAKNILQLLDIGLVILSALFAFVYPIVWHIKEKIGKVKSQSQHAFFVAAIRLWLAVMICTYAFGKILGTQFAKDLVRNDTLAKNLSGFDVTWFYFSYSYQFSVTIAIFQLAGAVLLLFRKTVFLGVSILLPVMLNIVLINLFYHINNVAEMNAVFYTIALSFLFSLFWKEIINLVVTTSKTLLQLKVRSFAKYILRLMAVGYAFIMIHYLSSGTSPGFLAGKWNVQTMINGADTINSSAWLTDSTAWKNIYLDKFGSFTLNPNPYVIDKKRLQKGEFHYDIPSHELYLLVGSPNHMKDHFEFQVTQPNKNSMIWIGQHQGKTLQLNLQKEN